MAQSDTILGTGRGVAGGAFLIDGMQSSNDPMFISERGIRSAMNVSLRGGTASTRPGYQCRYTLPAGRLQGFHKFTPTGSVLHHLAAVDGRIYVSKAPFTSYFQLPNIQFFPGARHIFFENAVKSARRNADGSITAIDSVNVVMMQDGFSRAAFWDGSTNRHLDPGPGALETPIGTVMKFTGGRLWVFDRRRGYSSDIADPLSFTENTYLAEGLPFQLPDEVTAATETPSVDNPQLLVFTESTGTLFQSNVRARSTWKDIDNFQRVLYPEIGCVGHMAVTTQYGLLWWFSSRGLISLNAAEASKISSELPYRDNDMAVSKAFMSSNLADIALTSYENFLLVSVPSGDRYNRHTWVLDQSPQTLLSERAGPAWSGIWTGIRPVQWAPGRVNGVERLYCASVDYDGNNRVWEAFTADCLDNGTPITSYVESKSYFKFSDKASGLDLKGFRFAEFTFTDIVGDLDVRVFWAGTRGNYQSLASYRFVATEGSLNSDSDITADTVISTYSGQSRRQRTPAIDLGEFSRCGVESDLSDGVDTAFSVLLVWSGRATLRNFRLFADPNDESSTGECHSAESGDKILEQGLEESPQ
jgi:hypothetical protein